MRAEELMRYIENPGELDCESVGKLKELVADFPYFQSAHLLLSLASKKWDASVYQQSLGKTAIITTNRSHFFNMVRKIEDQAFESVKRQAEDIETVSAQQKQIEIPVASKAAEMSGPEEMKPPVTPADTVTVPVKPVMAEEKSTAGRDEANEEIEKEIGRQVVTSFVEKNIIRTHDLHKSQDITHTEPDLKGPEKTSFSGWLTYVEGGRIPPQETEPASVSPKKPDEAAPKSRKQKNKAIIEKVIESNPGVIRSKENQKFYAPEAMAKESLLENEHLVTETLAKIYALQGSTAKAVRAYEILSLKYPQKSAYFASLIKELKTKK